MPACFFNRCEISDIAPDFEYNRIVNAFLNFKSLGEELAYLKIKESLLDEVGLLDEPELILEFEKVFGIYLNKERKKGLDCNGAKSKTYGSR